MDWHWENSSRRDLDDWTRRNSEESSRRLWDEWPLQSSEDATRTVWSDNSYCPAGVTLEGNPEFAAYWATLTLKQKIVGSVCSIAVGAAGAGVLIALLQFLH